MCGWRAELSRVRAHYSHRRLSRSGRREQGLQLTNDRRAFADRRGDTFRGARADVADGEDAGNAGLEASRPGALAGEHEASVVEGDGAGAQPTGVRVSADESEEVADGLDDLCRAVAPGDAGKTGARLAIEAGELAALVDLDVWQDADPIDEIA